MRVSEQHGAYRLSTPCAPTYLGLTCCVAVCTIRLNKSFFRVGCSVSCSHGTRAIGAFAHAFVRQTDNRQACTTIATVMARTDG